jgi:hypothetical protein
MHLRPLGVPHLLGRSQGYRGRTRGSVRCRRCCRQGSFMGSAYRTMEGVTIAVGKTSRPPRVVHRMMTWTRCCFYVLYRLRVASHRGSHSGGGRRHARRGMVFRLDCHMLSRTSTQVIHDVRVRALVPSSSRARPPLPMVSR